MDPLSIATGSIALAKTAFKIAGVLHSGIQAVKGVDATLQAFHGEITTLANALDLVGKTCQAPKLNALDKNSLASDGRLSTILQRLREILADCKETLASLDLTFQQAVSKSSISLFRRSSTALKLNFKSASIVIARQQIQTYISAMQMTISMLNISIILIQYQPSLHSGEIVTNTEALQKHENDLRSRIQDPKFLVSDTFTRNKTLNNLKDYLEISQSILTSATTVYGSEINSVTGNPLEEERSTAIEAWRSNSGSNEQETSFAASISAKRLVFALKNLEQQHYEKAETLLNTCISSPGLDETQVFEAKSALALCYEGQKNFEMAIQTFLELLKQNELPKAQMAHVNQNLARIHLKNGKSQEALTYALKICEYNHNNQKRDAYYDSCRLVAKAYQGLGDFTEAAMYYEEIPVGSRYRGKVSCKSVKVFNPGEGVSINVMSNLSNTGQLLVSLRTRESGYDKHKIFLWDMPHCKNRKLLCEDIITTYADNRSLQITQDGSRVLYFDGRVAKLHEPGRESIILQEFSSSDRSEGYDFLSLAISPSGRSFVLSTNDTKIACYNLTNDKLVKTLLFEDAKRSQQTRYMSFSPDGSILATSITGRAVIEVRDFPSFKLLKTCQSKKLFGPLQFAPNGLVLAATYGREILIWDPKSSNVKRTLEGHTNEIGQLSFSPDSNLLASASSDKTIKLWEVKTGKLLQTLRGHTDRVHNVCFSPDGLYLVSGSSDNTIRLWSVEYD